MKKILMLSTAALVAFTLTTPISAQAGGIWDMIKNQSSDGTIETKQYTIEVSGTNIRGYVYTVPQMKSVCWQVFSQEFHQMECKTFVEMGLDINGQEVMK